MKLTRYEYFENDGWTFDPINFDNINLIVGATGSGKTRLLATIFNHGKFIASGQTPAPGEWNFQLRNETHNYDYSHLTIHDKVRGNLVKTEILVANDRKTGVSRTLIERNENKIKFNGNDLPKLSAEQPAISLLKEEEDIAPVFRFFTRIRRRNFFGDEFSKATAASTLSKQADQVFHKEKELEFLVGKDFPLSTILYYLKEMHSERYKLIIDYYTTIFPFIESCSIHPIKRPRVKISTGEESFAFHIKERKVGQHIPLQELSSGMQKVLLILVDVLSVPNDILYIIDEYENSLGVNAIEFLPDLLASHGQNNQFIITTHHPYLINNMPMDRWQILHRTGSHVNIMPGTTLVEKYGKSKQQAFIKLINDPFYTEGIA